MPLDFHLDHKILVKKETEYASLYHWSIREENKDGKLSSAQVPWSWSLVFSGTEIALTEQFKLESEMPPLKHRGGVSIDEDALHARIEEGARIQIALRPGYYGNLSRRERYSMFGTDRAIKSFSLWIHPLASEDKEEKCRAWGCPSYTAEIDFRNEKSDDTLQFYLHLKPSRFEKYVRMLKETPPQYATLRLGAVRGIYSDWSPSISTDSIKVLTDDKEHRIENVDGLEFEPGRLGLIGSFDLTFSTKREFYKEQPDCEFVGEEVDTPVAALRAVAPSGEDASVTVLREQVIMTARLEKKMKELAYIGWVIVVMLAIWFWKH